MNTLIKALVGTIVLLALVIGLPILIGLVGLLWPVVLVIAVLIFIGVIGGIVISKGKED